MMHINRIFALALALCLLLTCFAGCGSTGTETTAAPTSGETEGTEAETLPQETTAPTEAEETEPVQLPAIDIKTYGGVVLVGVIRHDDNGWYLQPEQPLNVEYEYFLDNPQTFDNVTRISLFDAQTDGIEKSAYAGMLVTVEGTFSFYRDDFETLYLQPYKISQGKLVEQSYAAPELQPPEREANLYDPSKPLPEVMDPTVQDGKYVYNPYMLSLETLNFIGNDFADFYCDFVEAFLNYESQIPCPNRDFAEMLSSVIYFEFPLYGACADPFTFFLHYDPDTGMITIPYNLTEQEHRDTVDRFFAAANEFLATSAPGMSEQALATNIYHEICTRMTYDHDAVEDVTRTLPHRGYLEHTGVCCTFTNVYNQMLTQVGVWATGAYSEYTPTTNHAWSMIRVDGKYYFCDPTFELNIKDGSAYFYFGQTLADRVSVGMDPNKISYGNYYHTPVTEDLISPTPIQF